MLEGGNVVSEGGVVHLVEEDAEEGDGLFIGIGLELGVELNDKCRGDCGEQTSLCAKLAHEAIDATWRTHEYQGRVQVLVMFLEEPLVILLGNLLVVFVEPNSVILLSWGCVLVRAARWSQLQQHFGFIKKGLPVWLLLNNLFPILVLYLLFFKSQAVTGSQVRGRCSLVKFKPHSDRGEPGLCGSFEFRRFFDLKNGAESAGRKVWVQSNIPLSFHAISASRTTFFVVRFAIDACPAEHETGSINVYEGGMRRLTELPRSLLGFP